MSNPTKVFSEFVSDTLSEIEKDEDIGPNYKGRYS